VAVGMEKIKMSPGETGRPIFYQHPFSLIVYDRQWNNNGGNKRQTERTKPNRKSPNCLSENENYCFQQAALLPRDLPSKTSLSVVAKDGFITTGRNC
jgi:hypothetical protein